MSVPVLNRANRSLTNYLLGQCNRCRQNRMSPISWTSGGSTDGQDNETGDKPEELTLTLFTPETPRRRLSDLVVNAETERQLRTALAKVRYHKTLYEDWGLAGVHPEGRG